MPKWEAVSKEIASVLGLEGEIDSSLVSLNSK
jgi:hypothetical protein